jgi:hypothetical protein
MFDPTVQSGIVQPVAQTPIKDLALEDLGLLGSRSPRYGGESSLAPFVRHAELTNAAAT